MTDLAYTYLIGWSRHNKWYYGVRYAEGCSITDLWNTYFTSSKYVQEFRNMHGEPDIVQIRKIFKNKKNALRCENRVIRQLKLYENENFLNKSYSGSIFYDNDVRRKISESKKGKPNLYLKNKSKEHIRKMQLTKTGTKQTKEHIESVKRALKLKWSKEPHHCLGRSLSEQHKLNIKKGLENSEKFKLSKQKINVSGKNNGMFGKKHSEETKEKIRIKALQRHNNIKEMKDAK